LVGRQEGHPACKKWGDGRGGHWFSPDGVARSRMVSVSASVNLPLHHKIQKFSSGTGSHGWSRKKDRKTVVVVVVVFGRLAVILWLMLHIAYCLTVYKILSLCRSHFKYI